MALSYGLSLNMSLVFSIQNQCTLANYIISVERLNQYMRIPSEAPEVIKDNRPPSNWPEKGKVDICDLQVSLTPMIYWYLMRQLVKANGLKKLSIK
jgi:hypothetical protein